MKHEKRLANMLAAGLDSAAAERAVDADFTLSELRNASKKSLRQRLPDDDVEQIRQALQRSPVSTEVVAELVTKCDWSCCMCWRLDERLPIIIHHIEEHATGGGDEYDNLVVLCLNHHGLAHTEWKISRHPMTKELVRQRKAEFEAAVAEFKAGEPVAPGREAEGTDAKSHGDREALKTIAGFLDRPAVFRPFNIEGDMSDFLTAMADVIRALNTGHYQTREGTELPGTKPIRAFSKPSWQERLGLVRDQLEIARARVELAIRSGELNLRAEDGFYVFENPALPAEIDAMRVAAVSTLNLVLVEAGLSPLRAPNYGFA